MCYQKNIIKDIKYNQTGIFNQNEKEKNMKKNVKKAAKLIVLFMMIFSALIVSGCKNKKKDANDEKLTTDEKTDEGKITEIPDLATLSPDKNTKVSILKDESGKFYYSVTDHNKVIVENSTIGMELAQGDLSKNLVYDNNSKTNTEINETYETITGWSKTAINHCNETSFQLKNDNGSFTFTVRAYDDGIAYKYTDVKAGNSENLTVKDEKSEIVFPKTAVTWGFQLNGTYEGEYIERDGAKLEALSQKISTPMLAKVEDYYVLVTEAEVFNIDGQYGSSALKTESGSINLKWSFGLARDKNEPADELTSPAHSDIKEITTVNGFRTPWRVMVISEDLDEFTGSNLISNLNPEEDKDLYADKDYIKPGKVAWSWWSEGDSQGDYSKHVEYIDFAAENNWEYVCLDAGWRAFENRLEQLCSYGKEKGVGIFVWINYKDIKDEKTTDELFKKWHDAGVVGIKTDYFESDEPSVLKVMENTAKISAKNKLMILYHGCIRPGGEYRTYPNILTTEAVQGEEWHKWFAFPTVKNCLMYTFTRNICGSMDYTPVGTKVGSNDATYGFGIGQTVVYESALQHFAYAASSYKKYNGLSFLNNIPVTWDKSKLIEGCPGEYVTIARKNGENWYIGTMTLESRNAKVDLDFLDEGTYNAYIYGDNETGTKLTVTQKQVTKQDSLELTLLANGGAGVIITKDTIDITIGSNDEFNSPDYDYYEAESGNNTLNGTAVKASSAFCSGGQKVGYVGNGAANTLTFNNIEVAETGKYTMRLYYCSGENRKVIITVNGEKEYTLENLNSGDYVHPDMAELEVQLNEGENTITLSQPDYYAPDIDMIAIKK